MLANCKMELRDGLLRYPQELKEPFLDTPGLPFQDGSRVSAEEIWHFMTEEGPRKFAWYFSANPNAQWALPDHAELLSGIKVFYLMFSRRQRLERYKKAGMALVFGQGGQLNDPYFAAWTIALRPGDVNKLAADYVTEGTSERKRDFRMLDFQEEGNRTVSLEACHQLVAHMTIRKGVVPLDGLAPQLCLRCSDCSFLVESHRDSGRNLPAFLVDYPVNRQFAKPWAVDYMAETLRRLHQMLDKITGRVTTEEVFSTEIRLHNRLRRLAREAMELFWAPPIPPVHCEYVTHILKLADDCEDDPAAAAQVLDELVPELRERGEHGVKASGLPDDPVRLFRCGGSCFRPSTRHLQRAGAVEVGRDDSWSLVSVDVEEEGDPYQNFARALLSLPLEQSTEQRALWTVEQARRARADGILMGGQWGCNFATAIVTMCSDIFKREGIPTLTLDLDDLGRGESIEQTRNRIEAFVEMLATQRSGVA